MMRFKRKKRAARLMKIVNHYLTLAENIEDAMTERDVWGVDNRATQLLRRQHRKYLRICRKVNSYAIQLYW